MIEYLGEKQISEAIFQATEDIINEGKYVTYDLGGSTTTSQMAEQIALQARSLLPKK